MGHDHYHRISRVLSSEGKVETKTGEGVLAVYKLGS